ncbi:MAG: hypothetical protein KJ687_09670 [Proteobacteria bacterium]|nr:hypothetical protein [Pseudomonadota bacterium]
MDKLKVAGKSTLSASMQYLKQRDIISSYETLGITAEQAKKVDFVNCMMAFEQGLNLLLTGHHSQSVEPLRKAIPLIEIANDTEAKFIIPTLANFAEGISKLMQGNAHDAVKLLRLSSDAIQRLNFFIPGLEKILLSFKAAAEVAVARTFMNIGDLAAVESTVGKINQIHDELLSKLKETDAEDFPFFNEVYGTQIELSILFMRLDLEVLDFNALDRRIELTKENLVKLRKYNDKVPNSPIKTVMEIIQLLYDIFEIYSRVGRNIIVERLPLKESEMNELLSADNKIFEARQKANNAGDRGKLCLYTINQLKRLNESYFVIGKVQKKDFGRMSGLIALGAFVLQIIIVHLTIKPIGINAILFFLGEIILSLIAGYGYEALKFKPLLNLYADTIKRKTDKEK